MILKYFRKYFLLKAFLSLSLISLVFLIVVSLAPSDFPSGIQVHIPNNSSLSSVALILSEKRVISSPLLFKIIMTVFYGQGSVLAGDYLFKNPEDALTVAYRLAKGEQGLTKIKVTIPEGSTVKDIAFILLKNIPNFNAPYFIKIAQGSEGYLFPETYFFYPNINPQEILDTMHQTFDKKIGTLALSIGLSGRSVKDVVIMASIIEKEASKSEDRSVISGILWKRLDNNILLQVDAPFIYLNPDGYVSLSDTQVDSLYNTYKYKGLPKGPISNPGLDSLTAALGPTKTPYFYYLSDSKGKMHYAVDHDGHLINKRKYINKK